MKQPNPTAIAESLGVSKVSDFFSESVRLDLLNRIDALRDSWIDFDGEVAHSLGVASYRYPEKDKTEYLKRVREVNPILESNFSDLYERVTSFLENRLSAPVRLVPQIGFPGFFIVDKDGLDFSNRIYHLDIQYMGLRWKPFVPFGKLITFTGVLELPESGGGLDLKPIHMFECTHDTKEERASRIQECPVVRFAYEKGDLVLHDGLVYHRIAPVRAPSSEKSRRVTFQGHGVKHDGIWEIYW